MLQENKVIDSRTMLFKIIFIVLFFSMIASLVSGLVGLMNGRKDSSRVLKSLAWRVGLSIALLVFLILLDAFGVVAFHGITPTA